MPALDSIASSAAPTPAALERTPRPNAPHKEVAQQFESMFASILIKQMRQSMNEQGLFGQDRGDVLGGLFDHFMGQHLAQAGGLGIARMMEQRLEQRGERT